MHTAMGRNADMICSCQLSQQQMNPGSACADTSQAVYHGVPIVAMPFFGDQPMNAQKVISKVCTNPAASLLTERHDDGQK